METTWRPHEKHGELTQGTKADIKDRDGLKAAANGTYHQPERLH